MVLRKRKLLKRYRRKPIVRKGRKKRSSWGMPKAKASVPRSFQILNKYRSKPHYFEDSYTSQSTVGSGVSFASLINFNMSILNRYATLKSMYSQYRVKWFKIRIQMQTIENTDGAIIPELFIRYNYNPDLAVGSLSVPVMQSQQNVIYKRMLQGDGNGADFEYVVKPAILTAQQIYSSTSYTSAPKFNQWCDFQTLGTNEVNHYGMQMFIPTIPTGVTLTYRYTVGYECRDIV